MTLDNIVRKTLIKTGVFTEDYEQNGKLKLVTVSEYNNTVNRDVLKIIKKTF